MAKKVFIAATRQNDGKTSVSLGLFKSFSKRFDRMAYMKPVGQQYRLIDGEKIDKDAVLFKDVYALPHPLQDMSPIAVPSGFTEHYIQSPQKNVLSQRITTAYSRLQESADCVLIEGTGHGGVGSVFDMSNADVAQLLGAKVVLVTLGGIGKAIDELLLNKAFFESRGSTIAGVIINKVETEKFEKIKKILSIALSRHNLPILGMIPFVTLLTKPTVAELYEEFSAELLGGKSGLSNQVEQFVIGAMLPHDAIDYFKQGTLLIVPANREDLILTALCGSLLDKKGQFDVSAIIFTGGIRPHPTLSHVIENSKIPTMLVKEDSFSVATKINKMLFKLRAEEKSKIEMIQTLIESHVLVDQICEMI